MNKETKIDKKKPKLVFFVSEDWYFWSHRLELALAAKDVGYDITVVTKVGIYGEAIINMGLKLEPINMARKPKHLIAEIVSIWGLMILFRRLQPDIIHNVSVKPIIYGTIAARLAGVHGVVNLLTGLGWVFGTKSRKACILRPFISIVFRIFLNRGMLVVQNIDDKVLLTKIGICPSRIVIIRGSGVDLSKFIDTPEPDGEIVVLLASRMIWEKGISEFVEAAKNLHEKGVNARFVLVGVPDSENPSAIPKSQLETWHANGHIEWWGYQENMPNIFRKSHIVCLPSYYREGVPKVLIEAAACGRPIITTDMPGCREIVRHNKNGLLVRPYDSVSLADAIRLLIECQEIRQHMGKAGRAIVESEFSMDSVIQQSLDVYKVLLNISG